MNDEEKNESDADQIDKDDIFKIVEVKKSTIVDSHRNKRKILSRRKIFNSAKQTNYTVKFYSSEYEVIKNQAHQLNISIQKLFDILLVDGFVKKDPRIIEFINERVKDEIEGNENAYNDIKNFTNLEISDIVDKIQRTKEDD